MTVKCPICSDDSAVKIQDKQLNIYNCRSCMHTFAITPKEKQEKYDKEYFTETHKNWCNNPDNELHEFIRSKIKKLTGDKEIELLDIGCGTGNFLRYIEERDPNMRLSGIDLIHNEHPKIQFIQGDVLEKNIETKFDVICSIMAAEHINDPVLLLQKAKDMLKANGIFIITTIDTSGLIYKISKLLNRVGMSSAYDRLYSAHNLQYYTRESLKKLVERCGFDVLVHKGCNYALKSVDLPECNPLMEAFYKFSVWAIFLLSEPFDAQIAQTIVCRKRGC